MAKKTNQLDNPSDELETPQEAENKGNNGVESPQDEPKKEEKQDDLSEEVARKLAQKENKYNNLKAKYRELLRQKNDDSENESDKKGGKFLILAGLAILGGGLAFLFYKKSKNDGKNAGFLLKGGNELNNSNENTHESSSKKEMSKDELSKRLYGI